MIWGQDHEGCQTSELEFFSNFRVSSQLSFPHIGFTKEILLDAKILNYNFIALIHPIQWTLANPIGIDKPEKAILCFYQQDWSSTVHFARWLPSCLDSMTSFV